MKKIALPAVAALMVLAGCASTPAPAPITDTAARTPQLSTLSKLIAQAGLEDTLRGAGPYTVFAPSDEAFAKIPKADLDALLKDKAKLRAVLTYHVVPGKVTASEVVKLKGAKTVQGGSVTIDAAKGVKVDGANVVKTDIAASNGVIHVIDAVIMPKQ